MADDTHAGDGDEGAQEGADCGDERPATIIKWARWLMRLQGLGWSKALDRARDLYGEDV